MNRFGRLEVGSSTVVCEEGEVGNEVGIGSFVRACSSVFASDRFIVR